MDRVFNFWLVLLIWPPSVNICGRRRGRKSQNNGLATGALFFFSFPRLAFRARLALRAKCHVRLAWLIKRLLCRLGLPYLLIELFYIGLLVVRTDGGRSVYGHVITKFSGMDRFTYPWCSAGARESSAITIHRVCIVQYRIIFSFHLAKWINHPDPGWDRKVRHCSLF